MTDRRSECERWNQGDLSSRSQDVQDFIQRLKEDGHDRDAD